MPVRELSAELAVIARSELGEDPARIDSDLQHLRDWLAKQPHLRIRTDDQWLVAFLRGCKYSLERTKEKLDLYYSVRNTAPELYLINYKHPRFLEILRTGAAIFLPKPLSPDGPRVSIVRPGRYNPDTTHVTDVISVQYSMQQILMMEDDHSVVAGMVTILDLEGVNLSHFLQMTPAVMKKMVVSGQDANPIRMKGVHYLNTPTGFETVFNAMKALLNEKNKSRLYVHNKDYEAMYKVIPQEVLPEEYGGKAGSFSGIIGDWEKKLEKYKTFLEEELQFGTDESKRPGKPRTAEDLYGVEGSFRQLQFD